MALTTPRGSIDRVYDTVADMQASKRIKVGDKISTNGYTTEGDGGHADYLIVDAGTGTADGGLYIDLDSHQAQLIHDGTVDIKQYGARGDGTGDQSGAIQAALDGGFAVVKVSQGEYRCTSTLTKTQGVSLVGEGGLIGAQLSGQLPASTITVEGPTSGFFLQIPLTPDNEDGAAISHIYFRTAGGSVDTVSGIEMLAKSSEVHDCGFLNFSTGIKHNNTEAWIYNNSLSSCGICIDSAGGESHIYQNHGYPESIAILVRGSATIVQGNKFYGDGIPAPGAPTGVEVWGRGNSIVGNVLDAFGQAAIRLRFNTPGLLPEQNVISGNNISASGSAGEPFRDGILLDSSDGEVRGNTITGNTFFNRRGDRSSQYAVHFYGIGANLCTENIVEGNTIDASDFDGTRAVINQGANATGNIVGRNAGYKTQINSGGDYQNGDIVAHGLDVTPEIVLTVGDLNTTDTISVDQITSTTFRLLMRDSTGALINTPVGVKWEAKRIEA